MTSRASLLYGSLVGAARFRRVPSFDRLWRLAWSEGTRRYTEPIPTVLHGHKAYINFGNPYPIVVRKMPKYNAPLVDLVAQTFWQRQRPLRMVDVGAGLGDSVLLLMERCPDMVEQFLCFEGEEGFFGLLRANLGDHPSVRMMLVLLSDSPTDEPELVRVQHAGTATPRGGKLLPARTLDDVLAQGAAPEFLDIVKVDTDGFDGKVLAGSQQTLQEYRPAVIFEWHPRACAAAGVDAHLAFVTLAGAGYERYVFFDKFGNFSHFMFGYIPQAIASLAAFCTGHPAPDDWHYDVVALQSAAELSELSLAQLRYYHGRGPLDTSDGGHRL